MEFDIPIRVTAFSYDLEKKLILFVGVVKVRLDSEQGVAEVTATKGKAIEESQVQQVVLSARFTPRESPTAPQKVPDPLET